jgi:hypothetical protein
LELVHEDVGEAALHRRAHIGAVSQQITRFHQQIREIEDALLRLQRIVPVERGPELRLQRRGEIGVGVPPELVEGRDERRVAPKDVRARHAAPVISIAARAGLSKGLVVCQRDQRAFQRVNVARLLAFRELDVVAQLPGGLRVGEEPIIPPCAGPQLPDEIAQLIGKRGGAHLAVKRRPPPRGSEMAPRREFPPRPPQSLRGPAVAVRVVAQVGAAERAAHPLGGLIQTRLHPSVEIAGGIPRFIHPSRGDRS